jgi:HSP20 family molecular chaperone IbpA
VLVEFETGKDYRQFYLSEAIDHNRIEGGVLHLNLPRAEKALSRKMAVAP